MNTPSEKVDIQCPSCNRIVKTPKSMLGKTVPCPGCKADLLLEVKTKNEDVADWLKLPGLMPPEQGFRDQVENTIPPPPPRATVAEEPQEESYTWIESAKRRSSPRTSGGFTSGFPDLRFRTYWTISLVSAAWVVVLLVPVAAVILPPVVWVVGQISAKKPLSLPENIQLLQSYVFLVVGSVIFALVYRVILETIIVLFRISETLDRIERSR